MKFLNRNTLLLLLFFVSGAVGLICEVVWTRWLTGVLGSAAAATAIVLASFMAGLGAGSWISARMADRVHRPVRFYAFVEFGIASLVLLPFGVVWVTQPWIVSLATLWGPSSIALDVVRVATAVVAIGPPTVLMGLSLPLVVKAMSISQRGFGRSLASAYAMNSLGGVVGTLLAGFVLIETYGLRGTALVAGSLAVAVGVGAIWIHHRSFQLTPSAGAGRNDQVRRDQSRSDRKRGSRGDLADDLPRQSVSRRGDARWVLMAAAASGFSALGFETIWSRVLSLLTLNTTYAFSLMLAILLLGLSLGSGLIRSRLDRMKDPAAWFAILQLMLAVYAVSSLFWASSLAEVGNYFVPIGDDTMVAGWFIKPLTMAVCLLLVPAILMGASLPIVCKICALVTGGIGRPVGQVYAANTWGSVAGALLIGLIAIPLVGTWWATALCALLGTVSALMIAWIYAEENRRWAFAMSSTATAAAATMACLIYGETLIVERGLGEHEKLVFRGEDEYGLVEVVEDQRFGTRWMLTNRLHWEGSTLPRATAEQRKQGLLPLVLHDSPRRVLEIGVGTGIKLSALQSPIVDQAVVIEISPGVIDAARLFAEYNHGVTSGEGKVEVVCADGRNYVALAPGEFDVIVNGLLTPYRAGVSRLYTVEHFRNCRDKLSSDGMFVVWVAIRQIAPDDLKVLTQSLLEVFPNTTLWLDGYYAALVSTTGPHLFDVDAIERRCQSDELAGLLNESGIDSPLTLLATFLAGPEMLAAFAGDQPLNTEDRPVIEFRTPRLGERLNTSEFAAEMIGTLSMLQEPISVKQVTASDATLSRLQRAQQSRWVARQALIQKCYGDHVGAAEAFRDALALDSANDLARYELETYLVAHGNQCLQRGLFARAYRVFEQAAEVNPRSVAALACLAAMEEKSGTRQRAKEFWKRAASLDPHNVHLRRRMANQAAASSSRRFQR